MSLFLGAYFLILMMELSGKMGQYCTALLDGGYIKFWSYKILSALLENNGFRVENFYGAGRLPWLWKSMILIDIKKDSRTSK